MKETERVREKMRREKIYGCSLRGIFSGEAGTSALMKHIVEIAVMEKI